MMQVIIRISVCLMVEIPICDNHLFLIHYYNTLDKSSKLFFLDLVPLCSVQLIKQSNSIYSNPNVASSSFIYIKSMALWSCVYRLVNGR